jgi:hypothetical protein
MKRYATLEKEAHRRQAPQLARLHLAQRAHNLGTIEAPDEKAAEAIRSEDIRAERGAAQAAVDLGALMTAARSSGGAARTSIDAADS